MNRDRINEWIVKFNEGSLKGRDLEEFLHLLAEDPELQKEIEVDKEIDRMLRERDLLEFREAILKARERNSSGKLRWFLLAATLAILLIGGGFILYRALFLVTSEEPSITYPGTYSESGHKDRQPENKEPGIEAHSDSALRRNKPLLAERFVPLSSLESLVGEATRADDILVSQPVPELGISYGDSITFAWKTESSEPVEICLFDNKGTKVRTVRPSGKASYFMKTLDLEPGLYYWKLLKNDQLVTAGKIRLE